MNIMFDCKDEEALLKRIEEPYSPRIVSTTTYYGETEGLIIRYGMTTKKEIEEVLKDQLPDADCNLKYTDFTLYPNFSLKPLYDIYFYGEVIGLAAVDCSGSVEENGYIDIDIDLTAILIMGKYQKMGIGSIFSDHIAWDLERIMLPLMYDPKATKITFSLDADFMSYRSKSIFDHIFTIFSGIKETKKLIPNAPNVETNALGDF